MKDVLRELAALAVAGALALGAGEAYLWRFDPQELMTPAYDDLMGEVSMAPNAVIRHNSAHYHVRYTTNHLGFRGPDYPFEKEKGVYRVVVLGSSFVFGTGVNDDEVFTSVLARELKERDPKRRYEIVNLGWGGTLMNHHEFVYRKLGGRYRPDLVVMHLHFTGENEIQERNTARKQDLPPSASDSRTARMRRMMRGLPGYFWLCENSHLWAFKRRALAARMKPAAGPVVAQANSAVQQDRRELMARYDETLDALAKEACGDGAKVAFLVKKGMLAPYGDIESYLRRKAKGGCVNLVEPPLGKEHSFKLEPHWNPTGHKLVADSLADFILKTRSGRAL
jgi:hypothetical protein